MPTLILRSDNGSRTEVDFEYTARVPAKYYLRNGDPGNPEEPAEANITEIREFAPKIRHPNIYDLLKNPAVKGYRNSKRKTSRKPAVCLVKRIVGDLIDEKYHDLMAELLIGLVEQISEPKTDVLLPISE